jgi:hypothetical protein
VDAFVLVLDAPKEETVDGFYSGSQGTIAALAGVRYASLNKTGDFNAKNGDVTAIPEARKGAHARMFGLQAGVGATLADMNLIISSAKPADRPGEQVSDEDGKDTTTGAE